MSTAPQLRFSYEDYLRSLEVSELKLVYCSGVIYAMAGGTLTHAALSARVIGMARNQLRGVCETFSSDAKVRVESSDFAAFPDASIVCGPARSSPVDPNALVNPTVLVEVTSRSTEAYDRGEKLGHYQKLESLRAVLFVSHRQPLVTAVERSASSWVTTDVGPGGMVRLSQPALVVVVNELYEGVALESA